MSRRGRGLTGAAESKPRSGSPSVAPKDLAADSFRRVTRNYTEAYVARRALFREETKRRMTHIAARKAKASPPPLLPLPLPLDRPRRLAFDKRAELEERKKQSSWRNSLGWGRADDAILPVADDSHNQAPSCRLCGASFMALVRKRYKCPLCELAVCGSCFNQKIQLDPVIFTDLPITEVICKACYALVQEEEERATIAKAIETAPEQPLVYYHRVVMEVVRTLSRHLPRYENSVLAADSVADCEEAGKVEASLVELFKNFDIGVKKITAMKFESEKVGSHASLPSLTGWLGMFATAELTETRVQNSVKMALVGFLQENLARFRTLQNQRKGLLAQFIEDEKSGTKRKSHRKQNTTADGGQHGSGPFIATIDPAMSPMAGTKLTFTGTNFKSGTKVEIAGISCRIKFMGPDRLIVYSPALESEGLKNVLVTNPSGESHKLENVLLYSDEYFRLTQADRRQPDDAPSAGNETKRSSSDEGSGKRADAVAAAATAPSRSVSSPAISGGAPLAIDDVVANSKVPLEDPVIRLIHPAICPLGGGTTLRLTGNHFCNQSTVRIGGKDASVLHFSDLAQGESQSQQLEVRSPRLAKVGFHAVEVVNPGGKRYRLDDVLYYTDDPALLGDDHSSPAADKPAKAKEPSSAARRVSGFFGRASVSASSSPTLAKDNLRGATMRRAESTDNLEAARLGNNATNGIAAAAASRLGVLPTTSPVHLRNTSDSLGGGGGGGGYTRGNRNGDGDEESAGGQAWASRSASVLTKSPRQQTNPAPPTPAVSFGAMTIGDLIDDGSGSNGGGGGRVGGRPPVGSGHARSVSLDQSAIARGGGGRGVAAPGATTFLSSGGSGVGRGLGSSSSGGIFWNAIDDDLPSVSAPSPPSSSSSAHVPTSRLRWGATNKNH